MTKMYSILVLAVILFVQPVLANSIYTSPEKFREFNPDGRKYQFVKDYLSSLKYIKIIGDRSRARVYDPNIYPAMDEYLRKLEAGLTQDNVNWRIARNLLKKYSTPENGLMLLAIDTYTKMCEEQVNLNKQELELLIQLKSKDAQEVFPTKLPEHNPFWRQQKELADARRESLKKLLEASMLVSKVLISDKADQYGELVKLGITKKERDALKSKADEFSGPDFRGKPRQGQSFLEASVCAIREILEDKTWGTL